MALIDLGRYKDAADVAEKILIGIFLAAFGLYLNYSGKEYEKDKFCYGTKLALLNEAREKKFDRSGIDARIELISKLCPKELKEFTRVLTNFTPEIPVVNAEKAPGDTKVGGDGGKTGPSTGQVKPPESTVTALKGWVAVTWVDPKSFSETNFDVAPSHSGSSVSKLPSTIAPATILKARWQVNVRGAAADWDSNIGIVDMGQCVKVAETRNLSASERKQTWARVDRIDCDAGLPIKP